MLKEILETENNKDKTMNFVYKLLQNKETGTFHIIKAPFINNNVIERNSKLVYEHTSGKVNLDSLSDFYFNIPELNINTLFWSYIEDIRLASASLVNNGYNVCGNCIRELYKNNYIDLD